jgi:hypothetical protein
MPSSTPVVSGSATSVGTDVGFHIVQGHEADVAVVSATEVVAEAEFKVAVMTDV